MVEVIIVTTGLPGAGKGTFAEVAKEMGIPVLVMGDIIREEVKKRNMELTPENVQLVARMIRKEEGKGAVARRMIGKLNKLDACAVLIDGVRSMFEVEIFRDLANVVIVSIVAPFEVRLKRIGMRGREDDSIAKLSERDRMELSFGMADVMRMSEYTIENVGSLEEFKRKAKEILAEILGKYCPSLKS